jgi:predicted nucleotidyltransferase component of viral defense system
LIDSAPDYRFESEIPPRVRLRLKIEANTREHFTVRGPTNRRFAVESRWWRGHAEITTFEVEELLGTKLRALFQRKKGRDLFDLCVALDAGVDPTAVVDIFRVYTKRGGHHITRARFEENLASKIHLPAFTDDIPRLLPTGVTFHIAAGAERVQRELIALVPGDPWKGKPKQGARPPRSGKG